MVNEHNVANQYTHIDPPRGRAGKRGLRRVSVGKQIGRMDGWFKNGDSPPSRLSTVPGENALQRGARPEKCAVARASRP